MGHRLWCGEKCSECNDNDNCVADTSISCSPDCENLMGDKINLKKCIEDKCDNIGYLFDAYDPERLHENKDEQVRLIKTYGEIAVYPDTCMCEI